MANVFDTAAYILSRLGPMTAMKLQKLVYYSQAWSLVWDERPVFDEEIRAWAGGPVVPELFFAHQGEFMVKDEPKGDAGKLSEDERDTVEVVLSHYGERDGKYLSALTHAEEPWRIARGDLPDGERGNAEITLGSMAEYYGNL